MGGPGYRTERAANTVGNTPGRSGALERTARRPWPRPRDGAEPAPQAPNAAGKTCLGARGPLATNLCEAGPMQMNRSRQELYHRLARERDGSVVAVWEDGSLTIETLQLRWRTPRLRRPQKSAPRPASGAAP